MTRKVKRVRQVADAPERKRKVKRVKPTDDDWFQPDPRWGRYCLCAWVPPSKRSKLPLDSDGVCEHEPCPCPPAEKHCIQKPDNIVRTDVED